MAALNLSSARKGIHEIEIYLGILIGAVTFSGSLIAFGKLSAKIGGKPLLLPGRHFMNLAGLLVVIAFGWQFLHAETISAGMIALTVMTVIALAVRRSHGDGHRRCRYAGGGVHAEQLLSGWAAAATGFMLNNDLLIVVGALVGSSGAILSYIMCRAMNRNFISVIAGGFGTGGGKPAKKADGDAQPAGEVVSISAVETAELLRGSQECDHRAGIRPWRWRRHSTRLRDHPDSARERRQRALRYPPR